MARLGKNQLNFIAGMCLGRACVVGDKLLRSLAKAGCLKALGSDSFYVITADGLRAVADAIDRGAIPPVTMDAFKSRKAVK
ncbi:hypothetical protein [Mesorhizobium sp.]|uniref:hypothetical protein n=1 Tax=Mesorhizobium sp. TaxID=1871066 RepID=UPI000FE7FA70|nr:hypothetical protein [Mesorhizobium sp.]RWO22858.1 MAG: hypothetical protein EOS09_19515 [Mesorhizobium sp.]